MNRSAPGALSRVAAFRVGEDALAPAGSLVPPRIKLLSTLRALPKANGFVTGACHPGWFQSVCNSSFTSNHWLRTTTNWRIAQKAPSPSRRQALGHAWMAMAKETCAAAGETLVPSEPTGQPEHVVRFYSVAGVSSFENLQPTVTFPVSSNRAAFQLCACLPLRLLSL